MGRGKDGSAKDSPMVFTPGTTKRTVPTDGLSMGKSACNDPAERKKPDAPGSGGPSGLESWREGARPVQSASITIRLSVAKTWLGEDSPPGRYAVKIAVGPS